MASRRYNAVRNIVWAVINKAMVIIMPFAVRTAMIYYLGVEYTGLGSLFTSVLTVLSLAELGFSSAMVFSMYEPINKGDEEKVCALLNFYRLVYAVIGLAVLVVGLVLMPFLPSLISGSVPGGIDIYVLYGIYLANTVAGYFLFAHKVSLLTAYQRGDVVSKVGLATNVGMYSLQIVALVLTQNFYVYAALLPLSTIANNVACNVLSKRLFPSISCRGRLGRESIRDIAKRVSGVFLYKLSSTTRTSFDSIVISAFLGLAVLTQYQNYYMVVSSVSGMLAVVINAITASVGDGIVSKSREENYDDFRVFVFLYMSVAAVCAACLACLTQPFMRVWVGEDLAVADGLSMLFVLYFYVQTMGDIVYLYRTAAGLWWQDRVRPVVESVANIALNLLFVQVWGFAGVLLATVVTLVVINFGWGARILFKHYFRRGMGGYLVLQARQFAAALAACAVAYLACGFIDVPGIPGLFLKLACALLCSTAVLWVISFRTELFKQSTAFMGGTLRLLSKKVSR